MCVLVFACLLYVLCLVLVCAIVVCAWCMLGVCVCLGGVVGCACGMFCVCDL